EIGYEIIGELKGRTLLFKNRPNDPEIQAFNEKMRELWTKKIKLDKRNPNVLGIVSNNEYFTMLYRFRSKGDIIVKAHRYDPGANLIDSTVVKNFGGLFITPDFEMTISEDQTKALLYYIDKQRFVVALCYDLNTKKVLWDRTIELQDYNFARDFIHFLTNW
ncbi:MAG: hypothetical protein AAFO07_22350, partial [Bacteroidota bacterium]